MGQPLAAAIASLAPRLPPGLQIARRRIIEHPAAVLGAISAISVLLYLNLVRVFGLLRLQDHPLIDLAKMSRVNPSLRWLVLWSMVALGLLYIVGWMVARHAKGRRVWIVVLGGALVSGAILLLLFPYDAADIFDYIIHARIAAVYNENPFLVRPDVFENDPILPYVGWRSYTSTYGPLWVALTSLLAGFSGSSVFWNVVAFKLISGLFLVGSVLLVARLLARHAPQRALSGTLLLAWNPLVLYETLGHGHNDMVMVFWILLSLLALTHRRFLLAILALIAGALFKFIPLLFLPAAGLIALREQKNHLARYELLVSAAVLSALLVYLAYQPYWHGLETVGIFSRRSLYTTSLPAIVRVWLLGRISNPAADGILGVAAGGLTFLFATWQGFRAFADRSWLSYPQAVFRTMMFYLLVTCAWFQPWYALWPVALAAILRPGLEAGLGIFFGAAAFTKPTLIAPWVFDAPQAHDPDWRELRLGPGVLFSAWLYSILLIARKSTRRRRNFRPAARDPD